MDEKEIISEAIEAISSKMPKTTNAIDNAVSSVVDILDLLLTPFQLLKTYKDAKIDELKSNLRKKVNKIPKEDFNEKVNLNIIGPTLEALKYTILDDQLREMFENLLASSFDQRKTVFPSFVEIVKQLNSDEAKVLKYISETSGCYPLIDLIYTFKKDGRYNEIVTNFTDIGYGICEKPEMMGAYLIDLQRFGLISICDDKVLHDKSLYKGLEEKEFIVNAKKSKMDESGNYEIKKKIFCVTSYGESFLKVCLDFEKE